MPRFKCLKACRRVSAILCRLGEAPAVLSRCTCNTLPACWVFTGSPGIYVSLKDTIAGFNGILAGEYDHLPEQAFYMVGSIEQAVEKAAKL